MRGRSTSPERAAGGASFASASGIGAAPAGAAAERVSYVVIGRSSFPHRQLERRRVTPGIARIG